MQNKKYINDFKKANNNNIININIINKPSLVIRKKSKKNYNLKKAKKTSPNLTILKKNDDKTNNINKIINGYQQGGIIELNYNLVKKNKKIIKIIKDQ